MTRVRARQLVNAAMLSEVNCDGHMDRSRSLKTESLAAWCLRFWPRCRSWEHLRHTLQRRVTNWRGRATAECHFDRYLWF